MRKVTKINKAGKKQKAAKASKFISWIREMGGDLVLSEKLGVCRRCVTHWRLGKGTPKAIMMQKIVALSGGRIGYDDMIVSN